MGNVNIKGGYSWIKHIDFILIDVVCLVLSFLISFYVYLEAQVNNQWAVLLVMLVLLNLLLVLILCPYSGILKNPGYVLTVRTIKISVYLFFCSCLVFYVLKVGSNYSRVTILLTMAIYAVLGSVAKILWRHFLLKKHHKEIVEGKFLKDMVVVSESLPDEEFLFNLQVGDIQQFKVKAVYIFPENYSGIRPEKIGDVQIIYNRQEYLSFVYNNEIDAVFINSSYSDPNGNIKDLISHNIEVYFNIASITGFSSDYQDVSSVGINRSLRIKNHTFNVQQISYLKVKRLFDIVLGILGLIPTVIVGIVIKVAYLLHGDADSIFYTQDRIGLNGKSFKVYKFRSMVKDADSMLLDLLDNPAYKSEWERCQKFDNDPRITPWGQKLRKLSMDEMPQFLNVINGTMSLIGPRPLVPGELENHDGLDLYNRVKPGITGWWACNGRSNIEYRERLELEYYYVQHVSLELDLMCVMRTVKCLVDRRGAK